jgi:uncharacterized membrane protein YdbT with pleckstrin-like domain
MKRAAALTARGLKAIVTAIAVVVISLILGAAVILWCIADLSQMVQPLGTDAPNVDNCIPSPQAPNAC